MSKIKWVLLVVTAMVTCSLFSMDVLANDMDCEALKNQIKEELKQETIASLFGDTIDFGLLIEAGVAYVDENEDGNSESDFALTTVELALGIRATDWIRGDVVFLFEDPTFDNESDVDVDVGTITLGNTEKCIFL